MGVVEDTSQRATELESLAVSEVRGIGILGDDRDRTEYADGLGVVLVELQRSGEGGVEAWDGRPHTKSRTDQAVGARAGTAGGNRRPACSRTDCAAKSANSPARRVLHDTSINAKDVRAGLCSKQISICDVQVVSGNLDIHVVLEGQCYGVIDREVDLAVAHERINAP